MFPINFNFPYRKKDGSVITMEKALDGAGADLDLVDLDDIAITDPAEGDGLIYDNTAHKWKNIPIVSRIVALFDAWKKNGAYNLYNHNLQTQVVSTGDGSSVTVTVNRTVGSPNYGTFTIVGTVGSATDITIGALDPNVFVTGKKYKLTGCPGGGGANTYNIRVTGAGVEDHGDGVEFTATGSDQMKIQLRGASIDATFKPMITTDLNATYADYQPYTKTNRELTELATEGVVPLTKNDTYVGTIHWGSVRKNGYVKVLDMNFNLNAGTIPNTGVLFTIPEGYRPKTGFPLILFSTATVKTTLWVDDATGEIRAQGEVTGNVNYVTAHAAFI